MTKEIKVMIGIVVAMAIVFLISIGSFYLLISPKMKINEEGPNILPDEETQDIG